MKKTTTFLLSAVLCSSAAALCSSAAVCEAAELPLWVGDPANGAKLYEKHCAACHGKDAGGGRSGVALNDSGRMSLIRNSQMFAMIEKGQGLKRSKEHRLGKALGRLGIWDVVQHVRNQHLELQTFFPNASRYIAKVYEIDKYGTKRIQEATGKKLKDKKAPVFTFFDMEGEEGNLTYVPQDPIKLDELDKKYKSGYLVFLPFSTKGYAGQIGVAMDPAGVITKIAVHQVDKKTELLNKSLSRFEGLGKKGQSEPFKVGGGATVKSLAQDVFPIYMRAMETVTMYDREEKERTWADQE
jgi:hypothetical protein